MVWYKEVFKFIAGAAAWDALIALWFIITKNYYVSFYGIKLGRTGLGIALFTDLVIMILLSYFAWNKRTERKQKKPSSKRKSKKRE